MFHGRVSIAAIAVGETPRGGGIAIFVAELHDGGLHVGGELGFDVADRGKVLEDALGLRLVDHRDGEADMNEHIVADSGLRREGEVDLLDDAAEIDTRPCASAGRRRRW